MSNRTTPSVVCTAAAICLGVVGLVVIAVQPRNGARELGGTQVGVGSQLDVMVRKVDSELLESISAQFETENPVPQEREEVFEACFREDQGLRIQGWRGALVDCKPAMTDEGTPKPDEWTVTLWITPDLQSMRGGVPFLTAARNETWSYDAKNSKLTFVSSDKVRGFLDDDAIFVFID